jgi:hypothetical protein
MSGLPGQYDQTTPRAFAGSIPGSNKYEEQTVEIGNFRIFGLPRSPTTIKGYN